MRTYRAPLLPTVTVPDVVGLSSIVAAVPLASARLNTGYANPVGTHVIAESPVAGSKVPEHSTVILTTQGMGTAAPLSAELPHRSGLPG